MHLKRTCLILAAILFVSLQVHAQGNQARPLITQPVNESKLTELKGNTHPLARPEFDRGAAPADLPMDRMMLVLKRSPEQESALEKLLAEQTDKTSPNYHKWLTPEQFGAQFGPSDSDIQAVTSWLESHGFQIGHVAKGRNIIEFSGNAAQVQQAFHTAIHKYAVNGEEHWANSSDPQIPAALTPVVVGVSSLHNFLSKPLYHSRGAFTKSKATGKVKSVNPAFTFNDNCGLSGVTCYALTPYDFATIYNILPLWNEGSPIDGSGESIGVVGRSDIDIADAQNFRIFVGLPPNNPVITVNGPDPGTNVGDEGESDLDVEWAGAVARNATIHFVTSASTNTTDGVNLSAEYIVNNNLTPILSMSYGLCEIELGEAGASSIASMWAQAAAQGITVLVATGDTGASLCEDPSNTITTEQPGTTGLAVNGLAATPSNVAVGGTDFNDFSNQTTYWSSTNSSPTRQSALSYIPETTYNDSCTNAAFTVDGFSSNPESNCNNTTSLSVYISPFGGGGGASTVYPKPSWQAGAGVPDDGARDLPDVSMFSGDASIVGSAYVVCQADTGGSCVATNQGTPFDLVGGTSASAQVFSGVMALVDQKVQSRQGNANTVMYPLAIQQFEAGTNCNSSSPASTCIFNDVTVGTISMPCIKGSPDCVVSSSADANGQLSGCDASNGFDLATGLGSFNVENLVNGWSGAANSTTPDFWLSLTKCSGTVIVDTPGDSSSFEVTVTETNGFNGAYTYACSGLPSLSTCSFSTTNPDSTHTSLTVTVVTTANTALVGPTEHPRGFGWWTGRGAGTFACYTLAFLTLLILRGRKSKRSAALAATAFAFLILTSACGGGTSTSCGETCGGGGSPGTPLGEYNATLTVTSGSTSRTMNFTVSVR